jgi:hypothetical protein
VSTFCLLQYPFARRQSQSVSTPTKTKKTNKTKTPPGRRKQKRIDIDFFSFIQAKTSRRFLFQLIRKKTGKIFKREEEVGLAVLIEVYT